MAAKHFLSRKFTNFAFIGPSNASIVVCFGAWNDEPNWSEGRRIGYTEALAERGFEVNLYKGARSRHASANWTLEMPSVIEWIKSLPKPVAVFAPHDARARQVADACLMSGNLRDRPHERPILQGFAFLAADSAHGSISSSLGISFASRVV